jgi:hypothetical protein
MKRSACSPVAAILVAALLVGCSADASLDKGSGGDQRSEDASSDGVKRVHALDLLGSVLVCNTAPGFLGTGIPVLNVAYTGIAAAWDGSSFETALESDLGVTTQEPLLFQPNNPGYEWLAYPLPSDYPQSVTDLVSEYANVAPINSEILRCTSAGLLSGGALLDVTTQDFVVWDPRGGGTGD